MDGGQQMNGREEGAVAVVVALALFAVFAVGAIAVDVGSMYSAKRDYAAGTDAAALAAARDLYRTRCEAGDLTTSIATAVDVMSENVESTVDSGPGGNFTVTPDDPSSPGGVCGRVTASYSGPATVTFAGVLGFGELSVFAETTVTPGDFVGGGLRPFSVCMEDPDVAAWVAGGAGSVIDLKMDKSWKPADAEVAGGPCGGAPGNWGLVCYDDAVSPPSGRHYCNTGAGSGLPEMIRDGYNYDVDLETSDPADGDCRLTGSDPGDSDCDVKTGSLGGLSGPLGDIDCPLPTLAEDCEYRFPILGMNSYSAGPGGTAELHPTHFLGVVLRDFVLTGPTVDQYIRFELTDIFDEGRASDADSGLLERDPPVICDIDHNTAASTC